MGRAIAVGLAALLLLLGVILVANLIREEPASEERANPGGAGARGQPEETPAQSPASYTIEEALIGMDHKDAREYLDRDLEEFGFTVVEERVPSDLDKHLVAGVAPEPGTQVEAGATITLFVSEGPPQDEEEEEDD